MPDRTPQSRARGHAAAAALAAELGHELQGPLNLFRMAQDRLARGDALDAEDVALLGEELERLGRLSARLRGLARAQLTRVTCSAEQLVRGALALPPQAASLEAAPAFELDLEPGPSLSCDPAVLSLGLRELIDNAVEARATRAGVRFRSAGVSPGFCVWDDGPGYELGAAESLRWGVSTRPGAAGLGLTLALRAARAHGFSLDLRRSGQLSEAWLLVPPSGPAATRPAE